MKSSPENHWESSPYTWALPVEVEDSILILCDCTWFSLNAKVVEEMFCWSECDNCLGYGTMPIDWSEVR